MVHTWAEQTESCIFNNATAPETSGSIPRNHLEPSIFGVRVWSSLKKWVEFAGEEYEIEANQFSLSWASEEEEDAALRFLLTGTMISGFWVWEREEAQKDLKEMVGLSLEESLFMKWVWWNSGVYCIFRDSMVVLMMMVIKEWVCRER